MISRFLKRADEQFVQSALSSQKRVDTLAKLRGRRTVLTPGGILMLLLISFSSLIDLFWHRQAMDPLLIIVLFVFMLMQQDVNNQIRILELLQRQQCQATSTDATNI